MKEEIVIKHLKKHYPKLYKETNEKFGGRILNVLFNICGCGKLRSIEILEECIKKVKDGKLS